MDHFLIEGNILVKCNTQLIGHVIVPSSVSQIADFAFYGCNSIEEITIPEGIISIGNSAFYECRNLKKVNFPDSIEYIGSGLFANCFSLEEAYLPKKIHRVPKSMFYNCHAIDKINLPEGIKAIEHSAFNSCLNLKEVYLPNSLIEIGDEAFLGCRKLKCVQLSEGLKRIGKKVFQRNVSLNELKIPSTLQEVEMGAFETWEDICFESNESLFLRPRMFDCDYNYDASSKNVGKCQFKEAYLPKVELDEWKPFARILILISFFETYIRHSEESRNYYLTKAKDYHQQLLEEIIKKRKYKALNQALEICFYSAKDIEPYFDNIYDREEKAKILSYQNQVSVFDDLMSELDDLF